MDNRVLKFLADKLEDDIKRISDDIALGKCADLAAYKYSSGTVRGLMIAKNHIVELAERIKADDE